MSAQLHEKQQQSSRAVFFGALSFLLLVVTLAAIVFQGKIAEPNDQNIEMLSSLATIGNGQQTTMLEKVVWHPLRPEHRDFFPESLWLYTGPETYLYGHLQDIGDLKSVIRKGHYETKVMTFNSLEVAPLRSVCWDESTHVILFPPFAEYPDVHAIARTDLKHYVSTGNNLVFLGGFATIGLMNDVFGFRLQAEVYQAGPYYKSKRYSPNTVFEYLPDRLGEVGNIYGVKTSSLPPDAKSYYDTLGDSVVWSVRYDFGMLTYVGNDMAEAFEMDAWHKVLQAALSI